MSLISYNAVKTVLKLKIELPIVIGLSILN